MSLPLLGVAISNLKEALVVINLICSGCLLRLRLSHDVRVLSGRWEGGNCVPRLIMALV
jgi:hypothetical protein